MTDRLRQGSAPSSLQSLPPLPLISPRSVGRQFGYSTDKVQEMYALAATNLLVSFAQVRLEITFHANSSTSAAMSPAMQGFPVTASFSRTAVNVALLHVDPTRELPPHDRLRSTPACAVLHPDGSPSSYNHLGYRSPGRGALPLQVWMGRRFTFRRKGACSCATPSARVFTRSASFREFGKPIGAISLSPLQPAPSLHLTL